MVCRGLGALGGRASPSGFAILSKFSIYLDTSTYLDTIIYPRRRQYESRGFVQHPTGRAPPEDANPPLPGPRGGATPGRDATGDPHVRLPSATARAIDAARALLGERLTTNAALREHHSHGQDTQTPVLPDAVAFVETTDETAQLLAICHHERVPVVPWGAGTSLEGHVTPVRGGITLDLSRMTRVLDVSQSDMDCRVEAGVTRDLLNTHLRDLGLFFPVDPGTSACTIGGMCATRASGTNAVRYGTMRENAMGLTVALADGRVIRTGGRVRKSSTGYDLTRLFVGSEGTLGVITEIQLRLHGIPEAVSSATCQFPSLRDAVETVITIMQTGVPVARMELPGRGADGGLHRLLQAGGAGAPALAVLSSSTAPTRA